MSTAAAGAPAGIPRPPNPVELLRHLPRSTQIALGGIAIVIGALVLLLDAFAVVFIVALFGVAILFLGISSLAHGIGNAKLPGWMRGLETAFGVLAIGIAAAFLLDLRFGFIFSTLLFGFGLAFAGLGLISTALPPGVPAWAQAFRTIVGVLDIVFGFLAVLFVPLGALLMVLFVGLSLLFVGIELVVLGALPGTPRSVPAPDSPPASGGPGGSG